MPVAPVLFLIGAALVIAGTVIIFWPAALIVLGVWFVAAALDMRNESGG